MEFYIDDTKVSVDALADDSLESALRHTQENLCPPERLVVGIKHRGEIIPGDQMADMLQRQLSSFGRIDVVTSTKDHLVVEAMDQAGVALTQTEEACCRIADGLSEGKVSESMQALGECLSVWQQIHEAISKSTQMLGVDVERTLINGEPLVDCMNGPMTVLLRVKEALQTHDHVLLADTLKYEFGEVADKWRDVISRIQSETATPAG